MTTFTRTWNAAYEDNPEDADDALEGALRIRETREDVRERLGVDHYHAGDTHDGKHKKITLKVQAGDPTLDADDVALYGKAVAGKTQIFFKDEDGTITQLTDSGLIRQAAVQNLGQVSFSTGDVKLTIKTVADTGWVLMNDGTIGNATSGGTTRANADTEALFTLLWNNTADAECAVSSGRGANAAADFAASKTIALPKALGRALAVYGAGSGLTSRAMAKSVGAEDAVVVQHNHGVTDSGHAHLTPTFSGGTPGTGFGNDGPNAAGNVNTGSATTGLTVNNEGVSGTGANMQPTTFLNVMIKL